MFVRTPLIASIAYNDTGSADTSTNATSVWLYSNRFMEFSERSSHMIQMLVIFGNETLILMEHGDQITFFFAHTVR